MNEWTTYPWPAGYEPLRLLSEGRGGVVVLARNPEAALVALKLMRLAANVNPDEALSRHQQLQALTHSRGLLPLLACGLTHDRVWLWESFPPADDADGNPASPGDDYLPATLRMQVIQHGPLSVQETITIGLRIAEGLACLHNAGLLHRDVKTSNLLQVGGQLVLGDYGLVAPPGAPFDFNGTEGFMPTEGTADRSTDVFALAKMLYEVWTGCDRLEFPTIPKPILQNPEWRGAGAALNEILLRACSTQASERYQAVGGFVDDLKAAVLGRGRKASRRRWLLAVSAAGGVVIGVGVLVGRRPRKPTVHWRLIKPWAQLPQSWGGNQPIVDERRKCIYQFMCRGAEKTVHRIDLDSFSVTRQDFALPKVNGWSAILHPIEHMLWFAQDGRGPVWRINPENGEASLVGGREPPTTTDFQNTPYWNSASQRMGCFGGYGLYQVRNWRWEFDVNSGLWVEVEKNDPGREPKCRITRELIPLEDGSKLLLFGGEGNSSGKQGVRDAGFKVWNDQFEVFGDLWTLHVASGTWDCLAPLPGLELPNPQSCAVLGQPSAVVLIHAHNTDVSDGTRPDIFVHGLEKGGSFKKAVSSGDVPVVRTRPYLVTIPGGRSLVAFLMQGIYELTVEL